MRYRVDLEGLRALAVLPILLFHAGIESLSGGFIGVDIFFVISGFLITSIIVAEMDAGTFSTLVFYRRRIVRIIPALLLVLLVTLAISATMMLPSELRELGQSAAASAAFLSNVFFLNHADYFAGSANLKPLLHTWSLGVEEQFYIFYPPFMWLLTRYAKRWRVPVLLVLMAMSFAIGAYLAVAWPKIGFYLLPSRVWELGMGAIVALGAIPQVTNKGKRNALSLAGLALILVGLVAIRDTSSFPVPWALLPCIGAALLIGYGENSVTQRLFALPFAKWVGRISYSLYLWHWPIIALYRLRTGIDLSILESAMLIAASFAAASLSYYLVEQPILRRYRSGTQHGRVLLVGMVGIAIAVGGSYLVANKAANIDRLPPEIARVESYLRYRDSQDRHVQFDANGCFISEDKQDQTFPIGQCLKHVPGKVNMLYLGDSHAAQLWRALTERYPDYAISLGASSGCRPTLNTKGAERCTAMVGEVLNDYIPRNRPDIVLLAGRWRPTDIDNLVATVRMLHMRKIPVYVIGPVQEYQGEFPALLARAMLSKDLASLDQFHVPLRRMVDRELALKVPAAGGTYISAIDIQCPGGKCVLFSPDGGPMQSDYGHLTLDASRWFLSKMPALSVPQ